MGSDVNFKLDTGADVSIISRTEYERLNPKPVLRKSNVQLTSPGGTLQCLGEFTTQTQCRGQNCTLRLFVVNAKTDNLLGRHAVTHLGLIQRVQSIKSVFGDLDSTPVQCTPVTIRLKEGSEPYSLTTPRRVAIPLLSKVKDELSRMKEAGVIAEIEEPTDWCAPMVPVLKKSGAVRICTDFKRLNQCVKRERYMIPTLEDILHKLHGSVVYSKLDATSGFWQIPLDSDSAKLTTFITPFGRYFYQRLPQGISSAPEIFQRTMESILQGQSNVLCYMDDILVYSASREEHEQHLQETLEKLANAGLKLNKEKSELRRDEIEFLGFKINQNGVQPDPGKIDAVLQMAEPTNVTELRRILGMVNFLGKHIPHLSTILRPMTELLEKNRHWFWGPAQVHAFARIKELITSAPTLVFYDPSKPTTVSSDASCSGIGAVLLQEHNGILKPVAYCSRTLTPAEKRYAQIEKELLAGVWACERFHRYLVGLDSFKLETDHKPLVPLINSKDLSETPVRCQRMLLRLLRFNVRAFYTPGKQMEVADTLSRSPVNPGCKDSLHEEVEEHVNSVRAAWPVQDSFLERVKMETQKDVNLKTTLEYTQKGWPDYKQDVQLAARDYFAIRGELSSWNGILLKGDRIAIPYSMRKEVLQKIHDGHQGIVKCRERARSSVWWPGLSRQIQDVVSSCQRCLERQPAQTREPLLPSTPPDRPFQRVGVDICEVNGDHFLVLMDYYSRFIDIAYLPQLTSQAVIIRMKKSFANHGIPETVVSDNGTQFTSSEFKKFATDWNFKSVTSSPHYPQANGQAESGVKTAKAIITQKDPFLALLVYRATPIPSLGYSPAELAFGRKLRTPLPTLPKTLMPHTVNPKTVRARDSACKAKQKRYHDERHGARSLPSLRPGSPVLVKTDNTRGWKQPAEVLQQVAPRSYLLQTDDGHRLRRNRRHIRCSPGKPASACKPVVSPRQGTLGSAPPVAVPVPVRDPAPVPPSPAFSSQRPATTVTPCAPGPMSPTPVPVKLPLSPKPQTPHSSVQLQTTRSGRTVIIPARYRE